MDIRGGPEHENPPRFLEDVEVVVLSVFESASVFAGAVSVEDAFMSTRRSASDETLSLEPTKKRWYIPLTILPVTSEGIVRLYALSVLLVMPLAKTLPFDGSIRRYRTSITPGPSTVRFIVEGDPVKMLEDSTLEKLICGGDPLYQSPGLKG